MEHYLGQILVQAFSLGSLYGLLAIGFALIFGSTRVINLAHGSFVILTGYIAYILERNFGTGFIFATLLSALVPLVFLPIIIFISSNTPHPKETLSLILTFALSLVLQSLYFAMFSADYRMLTTKPGILEIPVAGLHISPVQIALIAISLSTITLLFLLFRKTMTGKAIRATIQNSQAALIVGIPTKKMQILATGLGCLASGLAGTLYVRVSYIHPAGDLEVTLIALLITFFAGRGRIRRILVSACLFAVLETLVSFWWGAKWRELLSSLFIISVLMWRGEELFNNSPAK